MRKYPFRGYETKGGRGQRGFAAFSRGSQSRFTNLSQYSTSTSTPNIFTLFRSSVKYWNIQNNILLRKKSFLSRQSRGQSTLASTNLDEKVHSPRPCLPRSSPLIFLYF